MYSTQRQTTSVVPVLNDSATVGRYLRYPDETGKRVVEGGMRIRGQYKHSLPDLPLVSVITVCFNSAKTIEQAILSVLSQTYGNIEYLIIDAASSDGTLDLIRKYESGIDYFVSEPDRGLYHAMNKGLELAQGDYILLLNSDDWYTDDAVEKLVAAKGYSGCSFVSAQARHVDARGLLAGAMRVMHFDHAVYLRMPLRHETMLLPRQVYEQVGPYNTDFRIIADYDFTIRLFEAGYTHYQLREPLLMFRQTGVSHTDTSRVAAERETLVAAQFPFLEKREIDLLIDRDHHTGSALMTLATKYSDSDKFVNAIHDYVLDHAKIALQGRGKREWRPHASALIQTIRDYRKTRTPLVSVILAVYNGEKTIRACIDSVLGQTFTDIELICVNDQTPDDSQAIINEYCARAPRVRSVINERNIGLGATRNRGIREAKGSYVFHIDPDDTIPRNALEVLVNYASKHDSELVRGGYFRKQFHHGSNYKSQVVHPLGRPETLINKTLRDIPELLNTPEGHWAYLYRADLARRVPYPENLTMGQDAIFLFSIVPAASKITVIPDVVYNYLENAESAMNIFVLQKYIDVLEWRRRAICILEDYGLDDLAANLRKGLPYLNWHDRFLEFYKDSPDPSGIDRLGCILRAIYKGGGVPKLDERIPARRREFLQRLFDGAQVEVFQEVEAELPIIASAPKVSVILPIYNAEKTLRQSIDSVLSQSLHEIELICINDQSPDGSQAIIDEYARMDKRIVPIINEKNVGHGATRNLGIVAARGRYIFHLDPDDTLPAGALQNIYALAERYGSDMTKGAYNHEQFLLGQSSGRKVRKGLRQGAPHIVCTTLSKFPECLRSTEGHWAYLYRAEFAKQVKYPEDLKMGQDSIFLVNAIVQARTISFTDALVYHYRANPDSAMNTFTYRKYQDALEWRRRAWHVLQSAGMKAIGDRLLQAYWSDDFFRNLAAGVTCAELIEFLDKFRQAFAEAGLANLSCKTSVYLSKLFPLILAGKNREALALMQHIPAEKLGDKAISRPEQPVKQLELRTLPDRAIKVATLISMDYGGAGTGSQRRVAALRANGVDARIYSLVVKSSSEYVHRIVPEDPEIDSHDQDEVWKAVRKRAIAPARSVPGYCASELFSLTGSVIDFRKLRKIFDDTDIVHLHWVVGMLDYENLGEVLADKPVVWTLADMNAFTGGCHYSEGCEEFTRKCKNCHLLGGGSQLAHEVWKTKKRAYECLKNLHIICPSEWMAERVRKSSLLGDRPVHVIQNGFPTDKFMPANKVVARIRLGLPLDKKLILFGADSLANRRKGGDLLQKAIKELVDNKAGGIFEAMVFGSNKLNLGVRTHSMGYVSDEERLSLVFSAADVYAFPSREDNAPLTVGESLLCGTPVVAFPVGNVPEILRHKVSGYIAQYLDVVDFAEGIKWVLDSRHGASAILRNLRCRVTAQRFHDPEVAAIRHCQLYREILS